MQNIFNFFSFCFIKYRELNLEVLIKGSNSREAEGNSKTLSDNFKLDQCIHPGLFDPHIYMHKPHPKILDQGTKYLCICSKSAVAGDILVMSSPQGVRQKKSITVPLSIYVQCAESSNIHLEDASVLGAQSSSKLPQPFQMLNPVQMNSNFSCRGIRSSISCLA